MFRIQTEQFNRSDNSSSKAEYLIEGQNYITEKAVLKYYKDKGFDGLWTENDYWLMLLSLLFWDVIFARVDGAVSVSVGGLPKSIHTYEASFDKQFDLFVKLNGMPSDMFDSSFFEHRQDLIKARYRQLANSNLVDELEKAYKKHVNENCRLINNWEKFSFDDLKIPLNYLDKNAVLRILFRILTFPIENRSGLPDLLIFNEKGVRFVEVKSEKDKLSDRQIGWIAFLSLDIDQEVEAFLINHTNEKVQKIKKQFTVFLNKILIKFGKASSQQYDEMVSIFEGKEDYTFKDDLHSASFSIYDKDLEDIVKKVGRWKSAKFFVDNEEFSVEQVRHLVYEVFKNKDFDIDNFYFFPIRSSDWFNCNNISLQYFDWGKYGYLDTNSGEWIFDKEKISKEINERLEESKLCPYLNRTNIKDLFLKLPDTLDLKKDKRWAFTTSDNERWIYNDGKWLSFSSSLEKQSNIINIIGIERISNEQREWILERTLSNYDIDDYDSDNTDTVTINSPEPSVKSKGFLSNVWNFLVPTKRDGCLGTLFKLFLILLVLGLLAGFIPTLIGFGIAKLIDSTIHFKEETTRKIVKYSIIGIAIIINIVIMF